MKRKLIGIIICLTMLMPVLSITAIANEPPTTPTLTGPTSGKPGVELEYTFMSIDPEGDNIFFKVSWGCCGEGADFHTYGPYLSGEEVIITKTYSAEGTYSLQAFAQDMDFAQSGIVSLEVSMPKSKIFNFNFNLFEWIFDLLPNAFPLLRILLEI